MLVRFIWLRSQIVDFRYLKEFEDFEGLFLGLEWERLSEMM